jgi:topoisomerase-4 subunit A
VFLKDGSYTVKKVAEKVYIVKDIIYTGIFRKKDTRTVYKEAYRDGKNGRYSKNAFYKRYHPGTKN